MRGRFGSGKLEEGELMLTPEQKMALTNIKDKGLRMELQERLA